MNHVKASIIARTNDPAAREALRSFPGRYFQVAAEMVDDPDDRNAVLLRVIELYGAAVDQKKRSADAAEAKRAESRRSHLSLAYSEPPECPAALSDHYLEGA